MKKIFIALILFGAVFAGISLACVCYMNLEGTDDWCEPAGCDTEGSYCATDGSYCKVGRQPACCSGLSCVNNECVVNPTCKTEKATCSVNSDCCSGMFCSVWIHDSNDKHCCKNGYYWNGVNCKVPDYCSPPCQTNPYLPECTKKSGSQWYVDLACCTINLGTGTKATWTDIRVYL